VGKLPIIPVKAKSSAFTPGSGQIEKYAAGGGQASSAMNKGQKGLPITYN